MSEVGNGSQARLKKQIIPATVNGIPEPIFRERWISMLWHAMFATGKGYHRMTLKNRPPKGASKWRGERRADKEGTSKLDRALWQRCQTA